MKSVNIRALILITSFLALSLALLTVFKNANPSTIRAFGTLLVDFGVPKDDPIFNLSDFKPGDCTNSSVHVTNDGSDDKMVLVKSDNIENTKSLASVLSIVIFEDSFPLYGEPVGKTLAKFYEESNPLGIPLSIVKAGKDTTYTIQVCFEISGGNEYQLTSTVFDLIFDTENQGNINLPPECEKLAGYITEEILGTPNNDNIHGTSASELIITYEGNDKVYPGGGHDCVISGPGKDRVIGSSGNDIIIGGSGNDKLSGGSGGDIIYGGDGEDIIKGGSGADMIWGENGNDNIRAGEGDDTIYGGQGNDVIRGNSGNDKILGEAGNDRMWGNSGNDELVGGDGIDKATGNSGYDICEAETTISCEF